MDLEFVLNMSKNMEMFSKRNNEFYINEQSMNQEVDENLSQHPRKVLKEHVNRQP
jgi:hypothetical protein